MRNGPAVQTQRASEIILPQPEHDSDVSLESVLNRRRSTREYAEGSIELKVASQLLWAAQGVTHDEGMRTAPSAGALYPLELYLVAGDIEDLVAGTYRYSFRRHTLIQLGMVDKRADITYAAYGQEWIRHAPMVIVITGIYERTTGKYGTRGERYVHMEVGHVGQNIYLQATSLGLGTTFVGAFDDPHIQRMLGIPEAVLGLMPIGKVI